MDRRVKERLIGASILVALVVLVVPELLSGRKPVAQTTTLPATAPEPTRIVTLDLATSKAPALTESESASQGSAAPSAGEPSGNSTPSTGAGQAGAVAPSAPSPATVSVETPAPSPISSRAAWAVQLGVFASRSNADNLSRLLKGQGFAVYVLPGGSGASARYRVRVGPLPDRGSAERTAAKLKSIGHASSLVAPAG
jgi:DedD protein